MNAIISFLKSLAVANRVGLLLGCIVGILLSFPYNTYLALPLGLLRLPSLVMMVTTGITQHSDYSMWPHWVLLFHLLAISIYYSLALLGYGYCGFVGTKRTGLVEKGFGVAFWACLVTTGTSAVVMALASIVQSYTGFGGVGAVSLNMLESLGPIVGTSLTFALLMSSTSCLLTALSTAIGTAIGFKYATGIQVSATR